MPPLRLNMDALAIICESLTDVSDVLSLALTSSSVRPIATRWLLYMHPIHLTSDALIRRFHSFLLADTSARAPHVRALDINVMWPFPHQIQDDSGNVSLILDILTSCPRLQHISIVLEQALGLHSLRIIHAIAMLQSLHSLSVVASVKTVFLLVRSVRSPLRRLTIHSPDMITGYWFPAALERFLPRLALTLEELKVYNFIIDQDEIQTSGNIVTEPVFIMTQYPAVRSLSTPSFRGKPLLDHFQHLFPALDSTLDLGRLHNSIREDAYPHIRAANQRAQESSHTWKKLDQVICCARMLYVLSLRCPIRLVMLDYCTVPAQRYAADALRENPVPRLKLALGHGHDMFGELFSLELAGTLTHLTLCLSYSNTIDAHSGPDGYAVPRLRWGDVLDKMVSTLQPLHKLTHLRVAINATVFVYNDAPLRFAPREEYAHALRGSSFDFEGTAASLVHVLPSLQYIFLTTTGNLLNWAESGYVGDWKAYEHWYISHAWRVAKPSTSDRMQGEERILVELHNEVAETIIRKELVITKLDEGSLARSR